MVSQSLLKYFLLLSKILSIFETLYKHESEHPRKNHFENTLY